MPDSGQCSFYCWYKFSIVHIVHIVDTKPIYVSRCYKQHVAKNVFPLEGRNYGMALMQNQNYQKILKNLNPVWKTLEHKEPILFMAID